MSPSSDRVANSDSVASASANRTSAQTDRPPASPDAAAPNPKRSRLLFLIPWLLIYVTTVVGMYWWYEIRPRTQATQQLQGTWQLQDGDRFNPQAQEIYLHIDGDEAWWAYPQPDGWFLSRSRIQLKMTDEFFVVDRAIGFDYGTTRESEFIVYLRNGRLYTVRGLAKLDPADEFEIQQLHRTDNLPASAKQAVAEYLERNP